MNFSDFIDSWTGRQIQGRTGASAYNILRLRTTQGRIEGLFLNKPGAHLRNGRDCNTPGVTVTKT
jgi:hypothetical protein